MQQTGNYRETTPKGIIMFHDGRNWSGQTEVSYRSKNMEHRPGIYLTNAAATAEKYAKGGGIVQAITLSPDLTMIDQVKVPLTDLIGFVMDTPRLSKRQDLLTDLQRSADRMEADYLSAEILTNLLVNYELLKPGIAEALHHFIGDQGIDAQFFSPGFAKRSIDDPSMTEEWMVLYNPDKILHREKREPSSEVHFLPGVSAQIKALDLQQDVKALDLQQDGPSI